MMSRRVGGFAVLTVTALLLGASGCGNGSAGTDGASANATATPASRAQFGLTPEPDQRQPFGLTPEPAEQRPFGLTPEPEETPRPSSTP